MWAFNYYLTQLSSRCQSSCQQTSRELETRCGREGHTRPRRPSENPDGVDPNIRRTRKTQRDGHNSGVKIWSLCSVSSTLSYANPWTTLSNPCNKVRGKYFSKEVFLRLPSCIFVTASFITASLSLCRCDAAWTCKWLYKIKTCFPSLFYFVTLFALIFIWFPLALSLISEILWCNFFHFFFFFLEFSVSFLLSHLIFTCFTENPDTSYKDIFSFQILVLLSF